MLRYADRDHTNSPYSHVLPFWTRAEGAAEGNEGREGAKKDSRHTSFRPRRSARHTSCTIMSSFPRPSVRWSLSARDPSFNDLPSRPLAARPRVPVFFLVAFLRPRRSSMVRTHPYYLPVCSPFILYALIYSTTLAHARF
jgi:hypothetical protein